MYFDLCTSFSTSHRYYLYATGVSMKAKTFETRLDAEKAMWAFCKKHDILVECTEADKHEKKYSNHSGVRFYINRI